MQDHNVADRRRLYSSRSLYVDLCMSVKPQTSDLDWLRTSANRSRIRFAEVDGSLFNNDLMHNSTEKIQIIVISFLY